MKPFVKWAGGKHKLVKELVSLMPRNYNTYYEPFLGGGALFLEVKPKYAVVNDSNIELLNTWKCISQLDKLYNVMYWLDTYQNNHSEKQFYDKRNLDKLPEFKYLPDYIRAARCIYLNKACFNGLWRTNSKGELNTPSGHKKSLKTYEMKNLLEINNYLTYDSKVLMLNTDFAEVCKDCKLDDFVYFDPPYDKETNNFTEYTKDGFTRNDQIRLFNLFKELSSKGVSCMLSNSATPFILDLYKDYNIHFVKTNRSIGSKSSSRKKVDEVIITNY